jgi:hypothetical protein
MTFSSTLRSKGKGIQAQILSLEKRPSFTGPQQAVLRCRDVWSFGFTSFAVGKKTFLVSGRLVKLYSMKLP